MRIKNWDPSRHTRLYKENTDREFALVYFSSTTNTVINLKYGLEKSFKEVFNRTDNWISERSGWITESINGEYVNISIYSPLSESSHIGLLNELGNSKKLCLRLTHSFPMYPFPTSWKHQKSFGFVMFSEGGERMNCE